MCVCLLYISLHVFIFSALSQSRKSRGKLLKLIETIHMIKKKKIQKKDFCLVFFFFFMKGLLLNKKKNNVLKCNALQKVGWGGGGGGV